MSFVALRLKPVWVCEGNICWLCEQQRQKNVGYFSLNASRETGGMGLSRERFANSRASWMLKRSLALSQISVLVNLQSALNRGGYSASLFQRQFAERSIISVFGILF